MSRSGNSGRVRVSAGGSEGLEELGGLVESSSGAGRATWSMPGPDAVVVAERREVLGEYGEFAISPC